MASFASSSGSGAVISQEVKGKFLSLWATFCE
jgi:hypothetical protein